MEKERVEKTETKEEKKLTEEKAAKVRGKKAEKQKRRVKLLRLWYKTQMEYMCLRQQ